MERNPWKGFRVQFLFHYSSNTRFSSPQWKLLKLRRFLIVRSPTNINQMFFTRVFPIPGTQSHEKKKKEIKNASGIIFTEWRKNCRATIFIFYERTVSMERILFATICQASVPYYF